ncbi:MAG TPA: hypothetical protein VIL48_05085 [Acidimicrobiales bacterium]
MAAELPERVQPVENAIVVDFPWEAAGSAISAINAAVSELESQLGARPGMIETLSDWEGAFRDEFDDAHSRIMSSASGIKEALASLASSIVTGAENANAEQRTNNWRVEHAGEPVPQ